MEIKTFAGLSYRQAQKRNSNIFDCMDKNTKQALKNKGYRNVGWENVKRSWELLNDTKTPENDNVIQIVDFSLKNARKDYNQAKESGDLLDLLIKGQSLISTLQLKYQ